jgi:hypothetical protein
VKSYQNTLVLHDLSIKSILNFLNRSILAPFSNEIKKKSKKPTISIVAPIVINTEHVQINVLFLVAFNQIKIRFVSAFICFINLHVVIRWPVGQSNPDPCVFNKKWCEQSDRSYKLVTPLFIPIEMIIYFYHFINKRCEDKIYTYGWDLLNCLWIQFKYQKLHKSWFLNSEQITGFFLSLYFFFFYRN